MFIRFLKTYCRMLLDIGRVGLACLRFYLLKTQVSSADRLALMRLHCATNAKSSDFMATVLRMFEGIRTPAAASGLLGDLSVEQQSEIAKAIDRDGFYVFEKRLPAELCDAIEKFAQATPGSLEGYGTASGDLKLFDPSNPKSKTYRLQERTIAQNPSMQQIMADASILAVAESYIGATPNLSMLNLWWSANFGNEPGDAAAQNFHFDYDPPPKWLLFFVYLTDVDANNGPHVYVRGSHKAGHQASAELLKRGYVRISDEDMAKAFGPDSIIEIHGKCGTVLAVDTRGFHKGKMLTSGHRLMAQLTFSYPAFSGAHGTVEQLDQHVLPDLLSAARNVPKVFSRYLDVK